MTEPRIQHTKRDRVVEWSLVVCQVLIGPAFILLYEAMR